MPASPEFRCVAIAIHISAIALCVHITYAQNAPAAEAPKASAELTFKLGRDEPTMTKVIEIIQKQAEERWTLELAAMNTTPFTRAIDLLRFVPFRLSTNPNDDFLMPNYLPPDYNRSSPEAHLFNTH
jgi:hypothetical protein